jgi:hypothetical protein
VAFLADQPRQLKHLEWPGFQNTVYATSLHLKFICRLVWFKFRLDAQLTLQCSTPVASSAVSRCGPVRMC